MNFPHVRNALFGQPWAIRETMLDAIIEIVDRKSGGAATPEQFAAMMPQDQQPDPGWSMMNNVAVVPIIGPIMRRANLFSNISGATSIDILTIAFRDAIASDAKAILLHIDSPGGAVLGIPELASEIYSASQSSNKIILALADGLCASAAYWLASQANTIFLTEASMVGSIGVIARIESMDRAQKNMGIDSTIIRSSELKGIGAGPMTPNQETAVRQQIMQIMDLFKSAVVRGRPGIDIEAVSNGVEFIGQKAIDAGLCDEISTVNEIIKKYGTA